jgi:glycerate 2-kinase
VRAGIRAADPAQLVASALGREHSWFDNVAVRVIAAGKAAPSMARAAQAALGPAIRAGLVIAPVGAPPPAPFELVVAEHPQPGSGSETAGRKALALARSVGRGERLLVLLSGGASSLMAAPARGITLEDKRAATAVLLRAGADIHALNTVRKHLSSIKGGFLAAASAAPCRTLVVSDVIGDDLSFIGSGPTVADSSTFAEARAVLDAFGGAGAYPPAVVSYLDRGVAGEEEETPKPGDARLSRSIASVIGGRFDAMRGAAAEAAALQYHVAVLPEAVVGEARAAGERHVARMLDHASRLPNPACVISSGETTVTVRGGGRGGRNQELALASTDTLAAAGRPVVLASAGTDGIDGPTDAAGALADSTTLARASAAGLPAVASFLKENDAYTFFDRTGDLIRTGPTGTNVDDLQVLLCSRGV